MVDLTKLKTRTEFTSLKDAEDWANLHGGRIFWRKESNQTLWYSPAFTIFDIMRDLPSQESKVGWETFSWKGFVMTHSVSGA